MLKMTLLGLLIFLFLQSESEEALSHFCHHPGHHLRQYRFRLPLRTLQQGQGGRGVEAPQSRQSPTVFAFFAAPV
jgi:hypothetical protein